MSEELSESQIDPVVEEPPKFTVMIYNDDFTPADFVTALVSEVFSISSDDADVVAFIIHTEGKAHVGNFTRDIAETKASTCNKISRKTNHPLLCDVTAL